MMGSICNRLGVAGIFLLVAMTGWAQAPVKSNPAPKGAGDKATAGPFEGLKNLPAGAIIVICEDLKSAKQINPNLILLTPQQYQELRDGSARARNAVSREEVAPVECRLSGKVVDDVVHLRAEFRIVTDKDRQDVRLGCKLAQPTNATLDGKLPLLRPTKDGLVVLVESKGEHIVRLDLEVSLTAKGDRGRDRGFELDLPGAAITRLELQVPEGVQDVPLGLTTATGRNAVRLAPVRGEGGQRRIDEQLGAVAMLDVSWRGPAPAASGPAMLTVTGNVIVRMNDQIVRSEAELTLKPRGQPVGMWRLHVPPNALLLFKVPGNEERAADVEAPAGPGGTLRILRLKEPTLDTIVMTVQVEQKRGQGGVPIGPFAVEGATQQRGDLLIAAPSDARIRVQSRGILSPREVTADEQRRAEFKAAFSYWNVPAPEQPSQPYPPLVEVDIDPSRATLEAQAEHTVQWTEEGWKVQTIFQVTPPASGVDLLSVQLPPECKLNAATPRQDEPLYTIRRNSPYGAEIKLDQKQTKQFRLNLQTTYPPPQNQQAWLKLPRLEQATGHGPNKVHVELPPHLEFEAPGERDPGLEIERTRYNRRTWTSDRLPEQIEIAWQPHRQELLLTGIVDVTITGRIAQVTQQIWFASGQAPTDVRFRVPETATDLRVLDRGTWSPSTGRVTLARDATEKRPLRVQYSFPLPADSAEPPGDEPARSHIGFPVPLLIPVQDARCETKMRVVSDVAALVERVGGPWEEMPLEAAADGIRLAALVLRGDRLENPAVLRLGPAAELGEMGIDRALIRARVSDTGQQSYHASFLLHSLSGRYLDLEFPAPPASLNVRIALGGLQANWAAVGENSPRPVGAGSTNVARVPLGASPSLGPTRLDVWYQVSSGSSAVGAVPWIRVLGPLQTALRPPRVCGCVGPATVRWQVVLPTAWVLLHEDGTLPTQGNWVWRDRLIGTRPTTSALDLERWITDSDESPGMNESESIYPSVVSGRTDLEPLVIRHAPQQAWLLSCSVCLLAIALGLYLSRRRPILFWGQFILLGCGFVALSLLGSWTFAAVLYGCEPGLAALLLIAAAQWVLNQRYRRQVVFLPSFKRLKPGDLSLSANGGSNRPREPSTVDAPPASASSLARRRALEKNLGPEAAPPPIGAAQAPGSSETKRAPG